MRWVFWWLTQQFMGLLFGGLNLIYRATRGCLFFKIEVYGSENVSRLRRPVILAAAPHWTYIDHFFLAVAFLFNFRIMPMRTMTADWVYKVPFYKLGFLLRLGCDALGAFQERRGRGFFTVAIPTLNSGHSVALYPEGIIQEAIGIGKIKPGTARLAQDTGAQILPVALRGHEHFGGIYGFFFGRRKIKVFLGPAFRIGSNEDLDEATAKIKRVIEGLYCDNARLSKSGI